MHNFLFYEQHLKLNFSNILWKFCLFEQHLQCNTRLQFFDYKQNSVPCTVVNMGMRIFESFARFWQNYVQESFLTLIIQTKSPSAFICLHFLFCLHFVEFIYILWNLFTFSLSKKMERAEKFKPNFAYIFLLTKREGNLNTKHNNWDEAWTYLV